MRQRLNQERKAAEAKIIGSAPYMPKLTFSCDDQECCWNGCPIAFCRVCGKEWPCADYRAVHSEVQVKAQVRWLLRKWEEYGYEEDDLRRRVDHEFEQLTDPKCSA